MADDAEKENKLLLDELLWKYHDIEQKWTGYFLQSLLLVNGGALIVSTTAAAQNAKFMILPSLFFCAGLILSLFFILVELSVAVDRRTARMVKLKLEETPNSSQANDSNKLGRFLNVSVTARKHMSAMMHSICKECFYNNTFYFCMLFSWLLAIRRCMLCPIKEADQYLL